MAESQYYPPKDYRAYENGKTEIVICMSRSVSVIPFPRLVNYLCISVAILLILILIIIISILLISLICIIIIIRIRIVIMIFVLMIIMMVADDLILAIFLCSSSSSSFSSPSSSPSPSSSSLSSFSLAHSTHAPKVERIARDCPAQSLPSLVAHRHCCYCCCRCWWRMRKVPATISAKRMRNTHKRGRLACLDTISFLRTRAYKRMRMRACGL